MAAPAWRGIVGIGIAIAAATVRTYLRDAYRELEVTNKIELLAALGRQQRDY